MDLNKAMKLNYYEVIVDDGQVLKELDTLLRRVLGKDAALIIRAKDRPKKWKFHFWATESEFETIRTLMDNLASEKLDEEYEDLIKSTTTI